MSVRTRGREARGRVVRGVAARYDRLAMYLA